MKLGILIFFLMIAAAADAATYFVRPDGGSTFQCTGLVDAPYPGTGNDQPCAYAHPFWSLAIQYNPTKFQGGDTLIIHAGSYRMGYDAPNQINEKHCSRSYTWDCHMQPIPSGPDPEHPTRILGEGWDQGCPNPPELYGVERVTMVVNLFNSSNVELQCLDITDREGCTGGQIPSKCNRWNYPYGNHADNGILAADSSNVLLKNLKVHGFTSYGISGGRLKDWRIEDTSIFANSMAGWNGDIGAFKSKNSGTMLFKNVAIKWNGCGETYPQRQPYNCFGQDLGGYGDGLGTHETGADWIFDHVDISHNASDGLDLLYHNADGKIVIKNSRFEGNAGSQVKTATSTFIENSILIGNCAYFYKNSVAYGVNNCRARGNTLAVDLRPHSQLQVFNSTLTGQGNLLIELGGSECTGDEKVVSRNNIFVGAEEFLSPGDQTALFYAGGTNGNGVGPCARAQFDNDYSIVFAVRNMLEICSSKHILCKDPLFAGPLKGDAQNVFLTNKSPAIGSGIFLKDVTPIDFSNYDRGEVWDMGALEYREPPYQLLPDNIAKAIEKKEEIDSSQQLKNAVDITPAASPQNPESSAVVNSKVISPLIATPDKVIEEKSAKTDAIAEEKQQPIEKISTNPTTLELVIDALAASHPISPWIYGAQLSLKTEFHPEIIQFVPNGGITNFLFPQEFKDYHWNSPADETKDYFANLDNVLQFCDMTGTRLVIQIDMSTAPPEEIAEWVKFMNKTRKGLRVDYWLLRASQNLAAADYIELVKKFNQEMKKKDSTIRVGLDLKGESDEAFDVAVIQALANDIQFLAYHWFPNQISADQKSFNTDEMMANAWRASNLINRSVELIKQYAPRRREKIEITFMGWDGSSFEPSEEFMNWSLANAIFSANTLGIFAKQRVSVAEQVSFQNSINGLIPGGMSAPEQKVSHWNGRTVRPKALVMELFAKYFGDVFLESQLTNAPIYSQSENSGSTNSVPVVTAFVSKFSKQSKLTIALINSSASESYRVRIILKNVKPQPLGQVWILNGKDLAAYNDGSTEGVTITPFDVQKVRDTLIYTVPAHSINILQLDTRN